MISQSSDTIYLKICTLWLIRFISKFSNYLEVLTVSKFIVSKFWQYLKILVHYLKKLHYCTILINLTLSRKSVLSSQSSNMISIFWIYYLNTLKIPMCYLKIDPVLKCWIISKFWHDHKILNYYLKNVTHYLRVLTHTILIYRVKVLTPSQNPCLLRKNLDAISKFWHFSSQKSSQNSNDWFGFLTDWGWISFSKLQIFPKFEFLNILTRGFHSLSQNPNFSPESKFSNF